MEKDLIKALQTIASYKLWGDPLEGEELALAREAQEYDEEQQCFMPCIDTESSMLDAAVGLARETLSRLGIPESASADKGATTEPG